VLALLYLKVSPRTGISLSAIVICALVMPPANKEQSRIVNQRIIADMFFANVQLFMNISSAKKGTRYNEKKRLVAGQRAAVTA
jgi:glucose uptake protein GlcU